MKPKYNIDDEVEYENKKYKIIDVIIVKDILKHSSISYEIEDIFGLGNTKLVGEGELN